MTEPADLLPTLLGLGRAAVHRLRRSVMAAGSITALVVIRTLAPVRVRPGALR